MKVESEAVLLRIHIGEADRYHGKPLYKKILEILREKGIAGATVLRGIAGYGKSTIIHTASILDISQDLPIVLEIVDTQEKIDRVLPEIEPLIENGLITMERVRVINYVATKE